MSEAKVRIGKYAAALIRPGESVFLDAGTTTFQVARYLPSGFPITVVTNAVNIASELMGKQIQTIVTGGLLMEATGALAGPVTVDMLSGMAFDRVFLGATGLDARHGFSNSNVYEAEVKKAAIRQAAEVNVVMDASKFGARVLFSYAPLDEVHRLVTDRMPDETLRLACEEAGMRIEIG
ncbi:DeoR/GlpR family DNA-binding transcription regulator [Cohnella laeviribosi]|nr:hypothetical protein [Cohnella laeviribosi]